VAKEAAQCFELPELPQVIFYAMLLNDVERLGILHGQTLRIIKSALTKLRWSTFEVWVWHNGDRILEVRFREEVEQKEESSYAKGAASPSDDDKHE